MSTAFKLSMYLQFNPFCSKKENKVKIIINVIILRVMKRDLAAWW